jgi:site-specific recombinase XerD
MKLLSELAADYAAFLKSSKPLSATTTSNYLCRVRCLLRFLPPDAMLPALTKQTLLRYLNAVSETSARAVRMHYAAIRHFCKWLISEEWIRADPCANIPLPKVKRNRRETVPEDAISRLMEACQRLPKNEYRRVLSQAALSLLVYGGLRRSEALHVAVTDVHLDRGEVFIRHGKGERTRSIFLPKEGTEAIRALLRVRPDCQHDTLLAFNRRHGVGYHGLDSILKDLHRVAGLSERYTPHQLRHAYASRLIRNGASLPVVQAALGHNRLETTATYLHTNDDDLRAVAHLASLGPVKPVVQTQTETAPVVKPASQAQRKRFQIERTRRTM